MNKVERKCLVCNKILITRYKIKYCSNKCQGKERYDKSIQEWKDGIKNGSNGIQTRIISSYLRRYLFEKYNNKCSLCGWSKINEASGRIPLEVDHIDGNSENNSENNLRLICPNCHALTPHFRNLNKGNGRVWRNNLTKKQK
jgi:predicted restriction endonuclease